MKVLGLDALQAQLAELGAALGQKTLQTAARKAFKRVLQVAQAKAPVDTGNLRDSIKIGANKPSGGETVVAVGLVIANNATKGRAGPGAQRDGPRDPYYWQFVEKGAPAHGIGARPFLRPALDGNADHVVSELKAELAKAIDRAVKRKAGGTK